MSCSFDASSPSNTAVMREYADVSVSRTGKDGVVRVKYRTEGAQTDKDDAYYYPTDGILEWAAGDNKAMKKYRTQLKRLEEKTQKAVNKNTKQSNNISDVQQKYLKEFNEK